MARQATGTQVRDRLIEAIRQALAAQSLTESAPHVVHSADPTHGDWSTNVALVCASAANRRPRDLAGDLAATLREADIPHLEGVEVAGPGFLNFHLGVGWLHDVLRDVVAAGTSNYARSDALEGLRINVEFVSANPTGPLHAGAGRWAAHGDSLCRLFERCGAEVHREYYLNDRGTQVRLFGESLAARRRGDEVPEDGYRGAYVAEWAAEMPEGADAVEWGHQRARRDIESTLAAMNVRFDRWASERELVSSGAVEETLADLISRGAVYDADGAVWLRASAFGDDKDWALVKSDGDATYLLPDIAYHRDKLARGADLLVDVLGADHHGYVGRLRAGLVALGNAPECLEVILGQLVSLERGGRPVRLSKRAGDLVELADLLQAVGSDVARLVFLLQSIDTRQRVDLDLITAQSTENPVYYLQYAHARVHSLQREAVARGVVRLPWLEVRLDPLALDRELALLRLLAGLPEVVEDACASRAPHRVTTWARDLARAFHGFYHDCPVLRTDVSGDVRQARLWLVEAVRVGLAAALDILGVTAPQQM